MQSNDTQGNIIETGVTSQDTQINNEIVETTVEKPVVETKKVEEEDTEFDLEDQYSYHTRKAKQLAKKLGKKEDDAKPTKKASKDELDYGQKAYLNTEGIKGADEIELVKMWLSRTGDDLESIVSDEIFQSKLKSLRNKRTVEQAIPKTGRRATTETYSEESNLESQYLAGKIGLENIPDPSMRAKILNKRLAKEKGDSMFSSNPVN